MYIEYAKIVNKKIVKVYFCWTEKSSRIEKKFSVTIDNKKSNLTGLKRYLKDIDKIPQCVTMNTYFLKQTKNSNTRDWLEKKRCDEVAAWLKSEDFLDYEIVSSVKYMRKIKLENLKKVLFEQILN